MTSWLARGRCAFGCLLLAALAVLGVRINRGLAVRSDLFSLVATDSAPLIREVAAGSANRGHVLIEGADAAAVRELAAGVSSNLQQAVRLDFKATLRYLDARKSGLLAPETRRLLLEGKFREVAEDSLARLYGPMPPLFPVKRDPFLLATDYAMSLQADLADGWTLKDGYPVREKDGRHYLLLTLDSDAVRRVGETRLVAWMHAMQRRNGTHDGKVWCCGPLFHAVATADRAQREINVLSLVSTGLVLLLGWALFRSLRFVPGLLFSIGSAFLVATAVLLLVYPEAHVLTFVFGTSLIGLSVDYVYHARAAGGARNIVRPLTNSFLTTVACFAPLFAAAVPVLREMALFASAGLLTAYASVFLAAGGPPRGMSRPDASWRAVPRPRVRRLPRGVAAGAWALLGGLVLAGLHALSASSAPAAFYRPTPYLARGETLLAGLNPALSTRFAYVRGKTLQEALEREEAAGLKGLSGIVPSLKRQRENAELVRKLSRAEGAAYRARTGLEVVWEPESFLDAEKLEDESLRRLVKAFRAEQGLIVPCARDYVPADPAIVVVEPGAALETLFAAYFRQTCKLLGGSLLALGLLLAVLFRRQFVKMVMPVALAFAGTAAMLGWLRIPVTFFTLLCFFVLVGLSLDYVIFNRTRPAPETRRTVFYSFLTSFAGLGMLSFTAFPVTRDMGITFALGLAFAYLLSLPASSPPPGRQPSALRWHDQREQSAGTLRLALLWCVYAGLGKTALKILCVPVMAFIYPFAGPARAALREFYAVLWKGRRSPGHGRLFAHLLGFAWSLADKTDACTLKKNLPKMTVRLDEGGRAFQNLVAMKKGAFLISTHVGTVEVLPALAAGRPHGDVPHVHAFQQMGHDAVFTGFFMKHFDAAKLTLHAVEDIGVETAVAMQEAIARGELVLMAGDRVSAGSDKTLRREFLGRPCRWPKGVFVFAKLMEAPVFFTTCVRTGWNSYEVHVRQFSPPDPSAGLRLSALLAQYVSFLETETRAHPGQWYQFYSFFPSVPPS